MHGARQIAFRHDALERKKQPPFEMHGVKRTTLRHEELERSILLLFVRRGDILTVSPPNDQGMQKTHQLGMRGGDPTTRPEVLLDSASLYYLNLRLRTAISA